jgi:putative flippase GtrA
MIALPELQVALEPAPTTLDVDIAVPVYNEQDDLAPSIERLHAYLRSALPFTWRITIVDNASTDGTWELACRLSDDLPGVRAIHLAEKGRGHALKQVWTASDATVLAYMDVDLSTDLAALLPLVAPLLSGHSDLAIGTRLARSARVVRGPKRELISRSYNALLHALLTTSFSDAQCGFKAIRADRAALLLPHVIDSEWFFDTELLVLAERAGLRIHEVPVDWVDDADSRVDIASTAIADLRGVVRVARGLATGTIPMAQLRAAIAAPQAAGHAPNLLAQVVRFGVVGVASTIAFGALFLLLRGPLGAQTANATSLLLTALANTAANRRWTFGVRGMARAGRHHAQGLIVFAVALGLTSGALAGLHASTADPWRSVELAVLIVVNLTATALRFVLLRGWVFASRRASTPHVSAITTTVGAPR